MRRVNAFVTALLFLLFLVHLIRGGLILIGAVQGGNTLFTIITHSMLTLLMVHVLIGTVLTVQTVMTVRRSGTFYMKENRMFLIRRISGFALMFFMVSHVMIFSGSNVSGAYRLTLFDAPALISQILLVICLLIHLGCNIRPLGISLGIDGSDGKRTDAVIVLSILLLLGGIAFFVYYFMWSAI